MAFVLAETIGLVVAIWPQVWLGLFSNDADVLSVGTAYLRVVGPFYGFFGMGWALYFASQPARRLKWPLLAGLLRLAPSVGGGWLALQLTDSLEGFFAIAACAMVLYGAIISTAIWSGTWFRTAPTTAPKGVMSGKRPAAAISADG